jgi:hypothetical protein
MKSSFPRAIDSARPSGKDSPVIILRSGYATAALFQAAVAQAERCGRTVVVIPPGARMAESPDARMDEDW